MIAFFYFKKCGLTIPKRGQKEGFLSVQPKIMFAQNGTLPSFLYRPQDLEFLCCPSISNSPLQVVGWYPDSQCPVQFSLFQCKWPLFKSIPYFPMSMSMGPFLVSPIFSNVNGIFFSQSNKLQSLILEKKKKKLLKRSKM